MAERHTSDAPNVIKRRSRAPFQCGKSASSARYRKLASMPVHFQGYAQLSDAPEEAAVYRDLRMDLSRAAQSLPQSLLFRLYLFGERFRVALVRFAPLDYLNALVKLFDRSNLCVKPETIQELRPQLA